MAGNTLSVLDERIVAAVGAGNQTFRDIATSCGYSIKSLDCRAVDRRLQSLRKRGVLNYTGSARGAGWRVAAA
jgi:hypothetical protein